MKARIFFQVYEEGKEEEGEYITYSMDWNSEAELLEFFANVQNDLPQRAALLAAGESMIAPEFKDG